MKLLHLHEAIAFACSDGLSIAAKAKEEVEGDQSPLIM